MSILKHLYYPRVKTKKEIKQKKIDNLKWELDDFKEDLNLCENDLKKFSDPKWIEKRKTQSKARIKKLKKQIEKLKVKLKKLNLNT